MVIKLNKRKFLRFILLFIILFCLAVSARQIFPAQSNFLGGTLRIPFSSCDTLPVSSLTDTFDPERFFRPSNSPPLHNKYTFSDFDEKATPVFSTPDDIIYAYYAILKDASNMRGYNAGCGTIGTAEKPYPYAYALLAPETQKNLSFKEFEASFSGIGHITLLKMYPAYTPDTDIINYMVELEIISGYKDNARNTDAQAGIFVYFYGIVSVENTGGYKIKSIEYFPENYLCAPWHSWFYMSDAMVQIVYGDNLKIISRIDAVEKNGDRIEVYASKDKSRYRFDFVRLTNGYDILLHEYAEINGKWIETDLLTDDWKSFKLSACG